MIQIQTKMNRCGRSDRCLLAPTVPPMSNPATQTPAWLVLLLPTARGPGRGWYSQAKLKEFQTLGRATRQNPCDAKA